MKVVVSLSLTLVIALDKPIPTLSCTESVSRGLGPIPSLP
jgi:hypothetical protein